MGQATNIPATSLWRSSTTGLQDYRLSLPTNQLATLFSAVRRSVEAGVPVDSLTADDLPLGNLSKWVNALGAELHDRSGFRLVDGFPTSAMTSEETERLFWAIGLGLGRPVSQSVMGERLGHVRDATATDANARAYRNSSELTPHSDPADLLAFLCINPAASGGISRFVSSLSLYTEIRDRRPDLLERLMRGYRYHRLGEQQPGMPDITPHRVPVFSTHHGFVSCRYVRQYIEVAADEDPTIELDDLDREAFTLLEKLAADPELHFEFTLQAGEAVFANNFTVMHARGSFEDVPGLPPRHLLRLWLATDPPRPITPNILHYEGEPGIAPVPGRRPSYTTAVEVQ